MKQFESREEAIAFGRKEGWFVLFYGNSVLDASIFLGEHPGGEKFLQQYKEQDIKDVFYDPLSHKHEALSIYTVANLVKGSVGGEPECIAPQWYDPKEALVPQIMRMTHERYLKAIDEPFHYGSPRMFASGFFEMFSHNKWHTILILHGALHLYILWVLFGQLQYQFSLTFFPIYLLSVGLWGLLEYTIHKYVFHSESILPDGQYWRLLHFTLHGIHHMIPMDPDRLVFPPVLGLTLFSAIIFKAVLPLCGTGSLVVCLGVHCGYVLYDMTHYFLHHSQTQAPLLAFLRRYHTRHHYSGQPRGFGVSYPIWDYVFGTALI